MFGCKCFIFKKRERLGKFERHCDIGFLVDYASNSKAYRVFNNAIGFIEETCDVEFDKSNSSQEEVIACDDVDDEPLRELMKKMAIGDIKSKEDDEDMPTTSTPHTSLAPQMDQDEEKDEQHLLIHDIHISQEKAQAQAQDVGPPQDTPQEPQVKQTHISKDQPIDLIIGSPSKGVRTCFQYASFCEHYSFVSCVDPTHVEEALKDPDWVMAMQEELNNFTLNEV